MATFHDLFVLTGEYSTRDFRARFAAQARAAAERADLVIAVSHFTARQVVELLGVDPSRVRVIYHGVRTPSSPPPPDEVRENLILHVGAIQARKNLVRLVDAFEHTAPGWRLVLAGAADGYGASEILDRVVRSPRRAEIDLLGYVGEEKLQDLYRRSRIFAFPSLDEGFGMPTLDAMANGVPVLTSDRSATAEIAGGAALLIEPNSTQSIAEGLSALLSEQTRSQYRERGLERCGQFSWKTAVAQTWDVYQELL